MKGWDPWDVLFFLIFAGFAVEMCLPKAVKVEGCGVHVQVDNGTSDAGGK